ncbi:MAG: hypothetical protein ACRC80_21680, partial [Waterburya sp.]
KKICSVVVAGDLSGSVANQLVHHSAFPFCGFALLAISDASLTVHYLPIQSGNGKKTAVADRQII